MFDSHIFDADHLGSKEEKTSLQYDGWTILAHVKAQNSEQVMQWAKHTYTGDGTEFNEQDNRYFIGCENDDRAIEVIPSKIRLKDSQNNKAETYNLIFEAAFFGYKPYEEHKHQELCHKILSKIKKKRGFLIMENKRFPV